MRKTTLSQVRNPPPPPRLPLRLLLLLAFVAQTPDRVEPTKQTAAGIRAKTAATTAAELPRARKGFRIAHEYHCAQQPLTPPSPLQRH
jgi:hypothetical protein